MSTKHHLDTTYLKWRVETSFLGPKADLSQLSTLTVFASGSLHEVVDLRLVGSEFIVL